MINREIVKTYYETTWIKSVACDICGKEYKDVQDICCVTLETKTFFPDKQYLDSECGDIISIQVCGKCIDRFKNIHKDIDEFIDNNKIVLQDYNQ